LAAAVVEQDVVDELGAVVAVQAVDVALKKTQVYA
jgi:hypothetical protein